MNASRSNVESLRIPPHSIEAEQAVLGGLMLDNTAWDAIAGVIMEQDFYRQDHRLIFRAMSDLTEAEQPFDAVTLAEKLKTLGMLDQAGGIGYLATMVCDTPTSANVRSYAEIVRERSVLRQMLAISVEMAEAVHMPGGRKAADLIELAEASIFAMAERGQRAGSGAHKMGAMLSKVVDRVDAAMHSDTHITGIATGLSRFDELTAGLQPGDLVVVAGRPSMGKTALALNIAEHAGIQSQVPTLVFSMEMAEEQLAMRMLSSLGRIDQQKLRTGRLDEVDWKRFSNAVALMAKAPIWIDDAASLTPMELRARARRMKREHGIGLIVLDYLQLMHVPGTGENRATEISEITRSLKSIARELRVPMIALSQLNRSLEQRPNKRPIMSDLRESGSIEQDADLIIFIYRDEVYDKDSEDKGKAEIIIGKQRNGPTDTVFATFLGQFTRFENHAGGEP